MTENIRQKIIRKVSFALLAQALLRHALESKILIPVNFCRPISNIVHYQISAMICGMEE